MAARIRFQPQNLFVSSRKINVVPQELQKSSSRGEALPQPGQTIACSGRVEKTVGALFFLPEMLGFLSLNMDNPSSSTIVSPGVDGSI